MIDTLVKECKTVRPNSFILAKVEIDRLCITARARSDSGWEDLGKKVDIPLDLLDPVELAAAAEGEDETEMSSLS